jgi:hypothetical protein
MKRLLLLALLAVSTTAFAQWSGATINVTNQIKLRGQAVTNFQTDTFLVSQNKIPTSKAVYDFVVGRTSSGGSGGNTLNPTLNFLPKKGFGLTLVDSKIMDNGNNVGINTAYPAWTLDVAGMTNTLGFRMSGGDAGDVLTNDGSGQANWLPPPASISSTGTLNYLPKFSPNSTALVNSKIFDNGTNVGIGTTSPTNVLHTVGNIRVQTSDTAVGRVLTDIGNGVAAWKPSYTPTVEIEDTTQVTNTFLISSIAWSPKLKIFLGVSQQCNTSTFYTYTSPDGINWTANVANGFILNWQCVVEWNADLKKFIATGASSDFACGFNANIKSGLQMSDDGINWEVHPTTLPRGTQIFYTKYTYSKELDVLLATSGTGMYKSIDKGLTFALVSGTGANNFGDIYWFKELNKFIAYPANSTSLNYSTDGGDTWTAGTSGAGGISFSFFRNAFFYDSKIQKVVSMIASGGGKFISSVDGLTWVLTGEVNPNTYKLYSYNKYLGKYLYYSDASSTSYLGTIHLNSKAICYAPDLNIYLSSISGKIVVTKMAKY